MLRQSTSTQPDCQETDPDTTPTPFHSPMTVSLAAKQENWTHSGQEVGAAFLVDCQEYWVNWKPDCFLYRHHDWLALRIGSLGRQLLRVENKQ
jgi:hypothetical protein